MKLTLGENSWDREFSLTSGKNGDDVNDQHPSNEGVPDEWQQHARLSPHLDHVAMCGNSLVKMKRKKWKIIITLIEMMVMM